MSLHSKISEIQAKIEGLLGRRAWGVSRGQGSFITMEFGQPVPPARGYERVHGEWHLWLYGCAWRLEQGERVVVASEDDLSRIETAIQLLEGCIIRHVELVTPALDAVITFEGDIILRLFSMNAEETDSWVLFTPDKVLTVGPAGQWSYGA